jgi:hypothetical protein
MHFLFSQGDRNIGKTFAQILEKKVAKTVAKPKIDKMSTSKLNLKAQNIYIKPLLKTKNAFNKPYIQTTYLGENVKDLLTQK